MNVDTSAVYTYKGFSVYQTRDGEGNLLDTLVCVKGADRLELKIAPTETISKTVHYVEAEIDKHLGTQS